MPRVVSLLPSATEIVCALGARDELVGRSHECDFPERLESVAILTRARVGNALGSTRIDRDVRELVANALSIYEVDVAALERAAPELVITQDLCEVCAVGVDDVRSALRRSTRRDVRLLTLHPRTLDDVLGDIASVGDALGRSSNELVESLRARIADVARRARGLERPRVLTLEWLDPVMIGGLWMPELVALAGGKPLVTEKGQMAPTLGPAELDELEPDVVLVKPCGFALEHTARELELLARKLPWERWSRRARVYAADGNAYFNRSGPRLVESLEILAACLHPHAFADHARRHAPAVRRVTPALELVPLDAP